MDMNTPIDLFPKQIPTLPCWVIKTQRSSVGMETSRRNPVVALHQLHNHASTSYLLQKDTRVKKGDAWGG